MSPAMPFDVRTAWPWAISVLLVLLANAVRRPRKYARFPPGPTPLPLIGNALDFPRTHLGREFAEMAKKYGDVVYLNVLGQDTVVLGSLKAARDLLDKRSANYSDRPTSVMVQLVGYDWLFALMNYGSRWRQHRRAVHPTMTPDVVPQYQAFQSDAARNLIRLILQSPGDLGSHIKFTFAAIVMGALYGIELREPHDKYYHMVERMGEVGEEILIPGRFPVEAFPVLRYLPSWFPGGGFKKWAADAKRDISSIVDYLFEGSKSVITTDASRRPMIHRILGDTPSQESTELEKMCKEVAATMYVVLSARVSNATMGAFFVAMALYPEVQKKAQQELDRVVGAERLPDFSDRPSLPYVNAIVKELLRWHPATPMGVPHRILADDEYNGHVIPGGATIFVNIWAIFRDPELYPQPDEFMPSRFLDTAGNLDVHGRDPTDVVFGFGRRICPGRHFADSALFILCASVLSAFEIGPPVGEDGVPIPFKREAADHCVVSHPKVHQYTMKPRSVHVDHLVRTANEQ
ncbi:cytochrome P450 [Ganoderma sinense ZZ0214-1]|uniref:Cytochrome P450 n=1 Tax=Ganoderma sinense ZZ0214-1 TaxID=1077348 RepID=A0A2G8RV64_9APHY|nr:cytochrome P450 [Ganoderma sinense ZZ0214-1]